MISHEFSVTNPALDVDVKSSSVTLHRGPAGTVTVEVDTKHPDEWIVVQNGDSIVVRDDGSGWRLRSGTSRVRITAPDGTAAHIATASGDVVVTVATGRTDIATASGDVRVAIAASLNVKTASGDIAVDRVTSDVAAKTASGDINAHEIGGDLEASTASGDIRVDTVGGALRVNTASGDVRIARFEGTTLQANTVSGDVTVGIPTGRSIDLDVKTLSGSVHLPERRGTTAESPAATLKRRVDIRVKSVSGDFSLQRA